MLPEALYASFPELPSAVRAGQVGVKGHLHRHTQAIPGTAGIRRQGPPEPAHLLVARALTWRGRRSRLKLKLVLSLLKVSPGRWLLPGEEGLGRRMRIAALLVEAAFNRGCHVACWPFPVVGVLVGWLCARMYHVISIAVLLQRE